MITAENDAQYEQLSSLLLEGYGSYVRVASEKRRLLSVDNLPEQALSAVRRVGATVAEDIQYDVEADPPIRVGVG